MSGIQQERITRRKHDGSHGLTNRLPIRETLSAANESLDDLAIIVSSFQAAAPGGDGFGMGYVAAGFDLFDPLDTRHVVVSHHFAHAYHTAAASGLESCAVLVCDLGGSTTVDGEDYVLPFIQWHDAMRWLPSTVAVRTECLSIYRWDSGALELLDREFVVPHSAPERFVFSPASLYENACSAIFKGRSAFGELMALASFGNESLSPVAVSDIIELQGTNVTWHNGWQREVHLSIDQFETAAAVARVVQSATELALTAYAHRAQKLAGSRNLAVAGGLFLNINTNSKIALSPSCDHFYAPSAPHDAGIAQGCALYGLTRAAAPRPVYFHEYRNDRLGPIPAPDATRQELSTFDGLISREPFFIEEVCDALIVGKVIARHAGRSEFGPRALGGRSLLASPCLEKTKSALNEIKGRQPWRPVAPLVVADRASEFFEGPTWSPFMNLLHWVHPEWIARLPALAHADGSTRAQTLERDADPELYDLLLRFGQKSGVPILVNTSLNGPDQPIIESVGEAIRFYLSRSQVDCLLLDNFIIRRRKPWSVKALLGQRLKMPSLTLLTLARSATGMEAKLVQGKCQRVIGPELTPLLLALSPDEVVGVVLDRIGGPTSSAAAALYTLVEEGLLELVAPG